MSTKIKIFVVFVSIFMLLFVSASATSLPDYYNSTESVYADKLPRVRNQEYSDRKYPDCWSYAAIASMEFSGVFNDFWDFSNYASIFSEHHMAACMNKTDDEAYVHYTRTRDTGGNREMATAYFSRSVASGPVLNCDFTETDYNNYLGSKYNYSRLLGYKKQATLTKAHFITNSYDGSSILEDGYKYLKNYDTIEKIKKAVLKFGGVTASYYAYEKEENSKYYNIDTAAYCVSWEDLINGSTPDGNCVILNDDGYTFKDSTNHAITIVGWDDNYSYENFVTTPYSFDGETYTPENGAWIVRNSWGEDFGIGGYEYISYMDPSIGFSATTYEVEDLTDCDVHTYTPRGLVSSVKFTNRAYGEYTANRYHNADGVISCIGLYICDETLTAKIVIDNNPEENLKNFTNDEFDSQSVALIDSETGERFIEIKEENPGYYVYKIENPLPVAGDFDVYVRYTVAERGNVSLGVGGQYGSSDPYTENVSYYTNMESYGTKAWRALSANWCVNAYVTKSSFEVPDVKIEDGKVVSEFVRYNPLSFGRIYLAVYKDGQMINSVSKMIETDREKLEIDLVEGADAVRTFIWKSENMEPYENYRKLSFNVHGLYKIS
ncbi:MAG: C1 family peptidase [Clostridia bacterium]